MPTMTQGVRLRSMEARSRCSHAKLLAVAAVVHVAPQHDHVRARHLQAEQKV